jgi:integrase
MASSDERTVCAVSRDISKMPFARAAKAWLETRRPYISPRTASDYEEYADTLTAFFGETRLVDISADQMREYQRTRMARAGGSRINQEMGMLRQMLMRIGRWPIIAADYQPLPVKKQSIGRALTDDERARLFRTAASKPHWEMAYLFAVLSVNTSCGPKEAWTLRLRDVDLPERFIRIQPEGAKNIHRVRTIPLNDVAFAALDRTLELARRKGSTQPQHFIFPFRVKGNAWSGTYDPERHCTTCKSAWKQLTLAAGLPGIRPYDMRHTAITDILQLGNVSEETAKSIAGHISAHILKTYSHIRMDAKRAALDALVMNSAAQRAKKKPTRKVTPTIGAPRSLYLLGSGDTGTGGGNRG